MKVEKLSQDAKSSITAPLTPSQSLQPLASYCTHTFPSIQGMDIFTPTPLQMGHWGGGGIQQLLDFLLLSFLQKQSYVTYLPPGRRWNCSHKAINYFQILPEPKCSQPMTRWHITAVMVKRGWLLGAGWDHHSGTHWWGPHTQKRCHPGQVQQVQGITHKPTPPWCLVTLAHCLPQLWDPWIPLTPLLWLC